MNIHKSCFATAFAHFNRTPNLAMDMSRTCRELYITEPNQSQSIDLSSIHMKGSTEYRNSTAVYGSAMLIAVTTTSFQIGAAWLEAEDRAVGS